MPKLKCLSSESGAVLVFVIVVMFVLLAFSALAIDIGVLYLAAEQAQNAADASSLAGAQAMMEEGWTDADVIEAVMNVAHANKVLGDPVDLPDPLDIQIGAWDLDENEWYNPDNPPSPTPTNFIDAVRVTVRRTTDTKTVPTFFGQVFDIDYLQVTRSAVAGPAGRMRKPMVWFLVHDASSSFGANWNIAADASRTWFELANKYANQGDAAGLVAFAAPLDDRYLSIVRVGRNPFGYSPTSTLGDLYRAYPYQDPENPGINSGIKYTTTQSPDPDDPDSYYPGYPNMPGGVPRKVNDWGMDDMVGGRVRPMAGEITPFDLLHNDTLPLPLDKALSLLKNGRPFGDTDPAAGMNYAIDRMDEYFSAHPDLDAIGAIILVSDGIPWDYRDGHLTHPGPLTKARQAAARAAAARAGGDPRNYVLHTITLAGYQDNDPNFEFNEGLIQNDGLAIRVDSIDGLEDALEEILKDAKRHPALLE